MNDKKECYCQLIVLLSGSVEQTSSYCCSQRAKSSATATALLRGVGGCRTHTSTPRGMLHATSPYISPALVAYTLQGSSRMRAKWWINPRKHTQIRILVFKAMYNYIY